MEIPHESSSPNELGTINISEKMKAENLQNKVSQMNLSTEKSSTFEENIKDYSQPIIPQPLEIPRKELMSFEESNFPKISTDDHSEPVILQPVDITEEKSNGVLKVVDIEGTGDDFPSYGDKVTIQYDGYFLLRGEKYHFRSENCLQFRIGRGEVIKGWDLAVMSMKKGESSLFIIDPNYGYGARGLINEIPPNTPLLFSLHLQCWEHEDLSPKKDGSILRKVLVKGENSVVPNEGSKIRIQLVGYFKGEIFEDSEKSFILGEGCFVCIPEGIEIALYKFSLKEKSMIYLNSSFALQSEREEISTPGKSHVSYEVTLLAFEKVKNLWEMNTDEKFEKAKISREKGIQNVMISNFKVALMHFKWIILCLENEPGVDPETVQSRNSLLLSGYLNLALCFSKVENFNRAIICCDKALKMEPHNEKALFRRGMAKLCINEWEEALKDFEQTYALYPKNKIAKKYILQCQEQIKCQQKKDKNVYNKMFEKFVKQDEERLKSMKTETGVWEEGNVVNKQEFISDAIYMIEDSDSFLQDAKIIELSNDVCKNL